MNVTELSLSRPHISCLNSVALLVCRYVLLCVCVAMCLCVSSIDVR